ncbi:hypothetical protein SNOG_09090 [Parastagonospora nodorum SN15]|uniref:Uncharacterized protein n=1 Tax=Phaeosphaeria nodorum (strain SN15 / ATCC MYA-4574 / FGSC 10173) TaxID=321614 RepID=Q0UGM4_PHANO|nr:hypothetical protein SNOG_09090 [Parastagonospora nodorum SN15]EAT83282.1 hypothetical protein SNOG_09090 [Parastagonospora nodorum SN15]
MSFSRTRDLGNVFVDTISTSDNPSAKASGFMEGWGPCRW